MELFSGVGNVSAAFRQRGWEVASFDKILGQKTMDITLVGGFLSGTKNSLFQQRSAVL